MKKTLYFVLPLLLALAFFTCKSDGGEPPPPLTFDQRLIGGRWYWTDQLKSIKSDYKGYYEFKEDQTVIIVDRWGFSFDNLSNMTVYSKDGRVYVRDIIHENQVQETDVMHYSFHPLFPYYSSSSSVSNQYLNVLAGNNDLIMCDYMGYNIYPTNVSDFWKFLVRLKADGTPYREYGP